ncbi:MAG: hypothetical protein MRY63_05735 [Neomegalonema sp.]|nr:hypothetical protein [Neomegalonema sp.]
MTRAQARPVQSGIECIDTARKAGAGMVRRLGLMLLALLTLAACSSVPRVELQQYLAAFNDARAATT